MIMTHTTTIRNRQCASVWYEKISISATC